MAKARKQRRGRKQRNMSTAKLNNLVFYAYRCAKRGTKRLREQFKGKSMKSSLYDLTNDLGNRFWEEGYDEIRDFKKIGDDVVQSACGLVSIKFAPLKYTVTCKYKDLVEVADGLIYNEDFVINTYNDLVRKAHSEYNRQEMEDALNEVLPLDFKLNQDFFATAYSVESDLMTLTDWNGDYLQINFKDILINVECVSIEQPKNLYKNKDGLVVLLKENIRQTLEKYVEDNELSIITAKNLLQQLS